jgi:rhodanese-related sulfurtransferase
LLPSPSLILSSQMYSPAELSFALRRGVPVLDVRPPDEYARGHVDGAVSVPLYRPITGLSPRAVARRAVFAFFGVLNGTEANPDFLADASAALGRRRTCVLICNVGGTMEETETNRAGQMSRSLSAAYELVRAGVVNDVAVLRGGVSGWLRADRETVGE